MSTLDHNRPHTAGHTFDEDGCCTRCGFDGDEWRWWKYNTSEGRASRQKMPDCDPANRTEDQR